MKKRNGFTLVELLVTISLLAVIGTIILYNTVGLTESTKELQYERMKQIVTDASKTYVNLYPELFSQLYTYKAFKYITVGEVIDSGLLDEDTENPYTKEKINRNDEIKVYVDGNTKELSFIYPVTDADRNTEVWLRTGAIDVEIPKGKSNALVNLYQGIYKTTADINMLALCNEDGFAIEDYTSSGHTNLMDYYKKDYEFKVVERLIPRAFTACEEKEKLGKAKCWSSATDTYGIFDNSGIEDYYYVSKAGNYYITYEWVVPETKSRRTATRLIRVIDSNVTTEKETGDVDNRIPDDDDDDPTSTEIPVDAKSSTLMFDLKSLIGDNRYMVFSRTTGNYVDTKIKLLEKDRNYTIIMTSTMDDDEITGSLDGMQFFHSMKEVTPYSGLTFRDVHDGTSVCPRGNGSGKYRGGIGLCSSLSCTTMCVNGSNPWKLVVYRDLDNPDDATYAYCGNYDTIGNRCLSHLKQGYIKYVYEYYDKTVLIGAGFKTNGTDVFRFMSGTVYDFRIYFGNDIAKTEIESMVETYKQVQQNK